MNRKPGTVKVRAVMRLDSPFILRTHPRPPYMAATHCIDMPIIRFSPILNHANSIILKF